MVALSGRCLCGQVSFQASGQIKRVSACYCGQCRAQNGGGPFYGVELQGTLHIENEQGPLRWFESSNKAKRGFCSRCGSSMFWQANDDPAFFDVSMGVLDSVENLSLDAHIFVDSCPPYMSVPSSAEHLTEAQVLARPLNES